MSTSLHLPEFPFEIILSFKTIVERYRELLAEGGLTEFEQKNLEMLVDQVESHPVLVEGLSTLDEVHAHQAEIELLLHDIFPQVLLRNEIKTATVPFTQHHVHMTPRFRNILREAGADFELKYESVDEEWRFIAACNFILRSYYGRQLVHGKPMYYEIPAEDGLVNTYKITVNADFCEVIRNENAPDLTEDCFEELMRNAGNLGVWKRFFPQGSYTIKGIAIQNMIDVTVDQAISELKTLLLEDNTGDVTSNARVVDIFETMFKTRGLKVGFTIYEEEEKEFTQVQFAESPSLILHNSTHKGCQNALCEKGYRLLLEDHEVFSISDVPEYSQATQANYLSTNLLEQDIRSIIMQPIASEGKLMGVLEIGAGQVGMLNSVNATLLEEVLPFLVIAVERSITEHQNEIKAIIQSECTSIHPSVEWAFEKEAVRFMNAQNSGKRATFNDISFHDVVPLYGQIDIVGSSDSRNDAIRADLLEQLDLVCEIFAEARIAEKLPIYEQICFRVTHFQQELRENLNASSEQLILNLLAQEVHPILDHVSSLSSTAQQLVVEYRERIDAKSGFIYNHRRDYDITVQSVNEQLAGFLDRKQRRAQEIYPHFYERFKTDGVEHNIYVGSTIARARSFNVVYLYNLRLWQLQTMCEMENLFYQMQEALPLQLEAASMILVFHGTLSISYRIDEKHFDVDGTYNARYEVIKKRIDKAKIKGTDERITTKGKIAVVYSRTEDEREYLRYIRYLQTRGVIGDDVEQLELEDVQGVVGLRALRFPVLYTDPTTDDGDRISYEDLIATTAE